MLYENVMKLCQDKNLKVTVLESELGFGRGTIGKWNNGKGHMSVSHIKKLADYFGVSIDELIGD